jgi:thiamine-phosphate pyrophosphorylase
MRNGNMQIDRNALNWRLYVITDINLSRGRTHIEIAKEAIAGGADAVQLRDKEASGKKFYNTAREIRRLTLDASIPFIINDRLDIAIAVEADGVHIGQDDLPAVAARKLLGKDKILGVSASSLFEAVQAERDGADYIGFGPIFEARGTKPDAMEPLGFRVLASVRNKCKIPVLAIGGINHENFDKAIKSGASGVAVISAVVGAENIAEAVRVLKSRIIQEIERHNEAN